MAKLLDLSKTRRIDTPEGDWYDILAVCKQEDINAAIAVQFKIAQFQQRIEELQALISEGGPVPADEFASVLDEALGIQRSLVKRFLRAWSHESDIDDDSIARIPKNDLALIISGIVAVVRDMRGVQADPKKDKPSDASSMPLSKSPEPAADGR